MKKTFTIIMGNHQNPPNFNIIFRLFDKKKACNDQKMLAINVTGFS